MPKKSQRLSFITRDDNNENHDKLLRFFDYNGIEHKWAMPMELLAGDGTVYRQTLLFLSSGEVGLPDLIRQSGQKVRGGHEVRVVDIPAFTEKYGVFEHLHFFDSGDSFSRMLCANAEKYHGTSGRAFIQELLNNKSKHVERIKHLIEHFKKTNTPLAADGQILRVLNRFALIAAAGTLESQDGLKKMLCGLQKNVSSLG